VHAGSIFRLVPARAVGDAHDEAESDETE
jgi:hypothetical protein